jgi:hypothetical protein
MFFEEGGVEALYEECSTVSKLEKKGRSIRRGEGLGAGRGKHSNPRCPHRFPLIPSAASSTNLVMPPFVAMCVHESQSRVLTFTPLMVVKVIDMMRCSTWKMTPASILSRCNFGGLKSTRLKKLIQAQTAQKRGGS